MTTLPKLVGVYMFTRKRQGRINQGIFQKWFIFHSRFDGAAWSGT
jgi:hypothetical protein